jgi:hypothetical protein
METFGKPSAFGELWYAEAASPVGPWGPAVKVLTHENYTFYNPRLHPEFTAADSPILIFEGSYTREFADKPYPTPKYDYTQILYRLDLDDPALKPAQGDDPDRRRGAPTLDKEAPMVILRFCWRRWSRPGRQSRIQELDELQARLVGDLPGPGQPEGSGE